MKKCLSIIVDDEDLIELIRILMDEDAEAALFFLKKHFKGKAREVLEGGCKVLIEVPGAGILKQDGNLFRK